MPTAVKFSQEFYERFGHQAVDELVNYLNRIDSGYRSELTELNELNFRRFDDKLERRAAELEARIDVKAAELEARIDVNAAELEARIDTKVAELEARIDTKVAELETRIDTKVAELEARIDTKAAELEARIGEAERRLIRWLFAFWAPTMLSVVAMLVTVLIRL
jgi:tetrahydromethanopterin S-methyltransferase subunit G